MARYLEFTTQELPAYDYEGDKAAAMAERMFTDGLPGFVLHRAIEDFDVIRDRLVPVLEQHGLTDWYRSDRMSREPATDGPMHIDRPADTSAEVTNVTMHLTEVGASRAYLFEVLGGYAGPGGNLDEADEAFRRGLVPADLLSPVAYTASLRRNSLIIFRAAGRRPMAHAFKTEPSLWRRSRSYELRAAKKPI
jgi:hypothetical protein